MVEPGPLPPHVVEHNHDLADQVTSGSTRDNGPRPPTWRPPLVEPDEVFITPDEESSERPYRS